VKVTVSGRITRGGDGIYRFPLVVGKGLGAKAIYLDLDSSYQPDSPEPTRPLGQEFFPVGGPWAYRGIAVEVKGGNELSLEEIWLKIKHAVLRMTRLLSGCGGKLKPLKMSSRRI